MAGQLWNGVFMAVGGQKVDKVTILWPEASGEGHNNFHHGTKSKALDRQLFLGWQGRREDDGIRFEDTKRKSDEDDVGGKDALVGRDSDSNV